MAMLCIGLLLIGAGNFLTAVVAAEARYLLVAIGMAVTGLGAGVLNGDTQKAIMACVPPNRTGMASGISTTTRFTAIVMSVGVLGAVLAARTQAAFYARPELTPALRSALDAGFLSRVLAGDAGEASAHLSPSMRAPLAAAAHASFASGFAAALYVTAAIAAVIALAVHLLSDRTSRAAARWV
jgi:hypothetical protein